MTDVSNENSMPIMPPSPGALMKAGRERAGIHLAVLSANLKVPVKQLASLEADDYAQLASPVFARALAAKVCRLVNIDPEPVLALMPANTNGLKPLVLIGDDQNAPSTQGHQTGAAYRGFKLWWAALALILLALLFSNEWVVTVLHLEDSSGSPQTLPTMPPEELPAAAESAQPEPPKAMVFEATNTTQVATPQSTASPSTSAAPAHVSVPAHMSVPGSVAPVNVPSESSK